MLIMLSVFLMPICIGASWQAIEKRVPEYMAAFLLTEVLMIGTFAAQDLFLFYIFFEAGLIPMFLIIGIWGGKRRVYASFKFFLYTLLGSVLMLLAIMAMYWAAGTTDIAALQRGAATAPIGTPRRVADVPLPQGSGTAVLAGVAAPAAPAAPAILPAICSGVIASAGLAATMRSASPKTMRA